MTRLVWAGTLVIVGPMAFGGDEQAVVAAEEGFIISEHRRATR
jgi:hypothetical protein